MPKQLVGMAIFAVCFSVAAGDWKSYYRENRAEFRDEKKAAAAILDCADHDSGDAARFLLGLACRRSMPLDRRAQALWVLRQYESKEATAVITTFFKGVRNYDAQLLAFAIDRELVQPKDLVSLMGNSDPAVCAVAISGIGKTRTHPDTTVKKLCGRIKAMSKYRSVQIAGMEALGGISSRLGIETLLERLQDGPYKSDALVALMRLTGENHGFDAGAWTQWFKKNPKFTPMNAPLKEVVAKVKAEQAEDLPEDLPEFYGLKITGTNVLFVLDRSETMKSVRGKITRLNRLKEELRTMAESLPESTSYGVLFFPDNAFFPRNYVSQATPAFNKRMSNFLEPLKPDGTTPTTEAMTLAFEKMVDRRCIDTIVLLADSSPNRRSAAVRNTIRELNRGRRVTIHTVSLGIASSFLKGVAADSGGEYMELKGN